MIINKNSKFALVGHGFSLFHLFNEIVKNIPGFHWFTDHDMLSKLPESDLL